MNDEIAMAMLRNESPVPESRFVGMTEDEIADYMETQDIRRAEAVAESAYCGNLYAGNSFCGDLFEESWSIF